MFSSAAGIVLGFCTLAVSRGYTMGQQCCDAGEFAVVHSRGLPGPVWCSVPVLAVDHRFGVWRRSQSRVDARTEYA